MRRGEGGRRGRRDGARRACRARNSCQPRRIGRETEHTHERHARADACLAPSQRTHLGLQVLAVAAPGRRKGDEDAVLSRRRDAGVERGRREIQHVRGLGAHTALRKARGAGWGWGCAGAKEGEARKLPHAWQRGRHSAAAPRREYKRR